MTVLVAPYEASLDRRDPAHSLLDVDREVWLASVQQETDLVSLSEGQGFLKLPHLSCIFCCGIIFWCNSQCLNFSKLSQGSVLYFRQEDPSSRGRD
ncbi:hypothetical protein T4D_11876 [Trichinella pseudospiralis]|uniref:Uncharacterized protein n=1 Tax=Trichinella pseudospiralis TaxID=6337 RepID=A0A0V1F4K7_TRIPS|nr:hypothetical protein T4D_11876 [Trichinella pseudospiralis]